MKEVLHLVTNSKKIWSKLMQSGTKTWYKRSFHLLNVHLTSKCVHLTSKWPKNNCLRHNIIDNFSINYPIQFLTRVFVRSQNNKLLFLIKAQWFDLLMECNITYIFLHIITKLIKRQSCYHIETSRLIGFYIMVTLTFNELLFCNYKYHYPLFYYPFFFNFPNSGWLAHLVSRFACNTRVIVDASSNPPVSNVKSL